VPWLETAIGTAAAFARPLPICRSCAMLAHRRDRRSIPEDAVAAGLALWLVYGTLRGDAVIIVANGISLVLLGGIIYFKIRSRSHDHEASELHPPTTVA
jgi:MtN3 and saliva related transmembrane protein